MQIIFKNCELIRTQKRKIILNNKNNKLNVQLAIYFLNNKFRKMKKNN